MSNQHPILILVLTKNTYNQRIFKSARNEGIEPTLEVLETPVLPLYEFRKFQNNKHGKFIKIV